VTHIVVGANHDSILGNEQYVQQVSHAILHMIEAAQTGEPLASRELEGYTIVAPPTNQPPKYAFWLPAIIPYVT
jgi:hypothetical protein